MRKRYILAASTAVILGSFTALAANQHGAHAPAARAAATSRPQYGSFGFDAAGMDRNVAPGASFYNYANGNWDRTTAIPEDRSNYGMFTLLADLSQTRTREIVEQAARAPGSRIGDFYASFMDEAAVNAAGITPLRPMIARVQAIANRSDWAAEAGRLFRQGVTAPFNGYVNSDERNPNEMIARLIQSGLGLPDRDYYLSEQPDLVSKRTAYQAYLAQLLTLAGERNGAARAAAVLAFERQLAEAQWTRVQNRDEEATYNRWAIADFATNAPGFDWARYFQETGLSGQTHILVSQPSTFTATARIVSETDLGVLKDYMLLRLVDNAAPFLSQPFVDANFAFRGTVLNGTPQNTDRWKRGVDLVTAAIPDDVSRIYVQRYFPPEAKREADAMVRNVIAAMDRRLAGLTWMAPETKARARAKLAAFTPKIGYPDSWRDYSSVRVSRTNLLQNILNATEFEYQRNLNKLGRPVDRTEWGMTPMTVNAYANPVWNEIVFPAAILQPPFFDPHADPAVNYGGIAAVIGHEISHHFDDQGSHYDETGRLREWWTAEDRTRFNALTAQLVAQYDAYEPLPGRHVQGALTLGENIADLAGLTVAYDAYQHMLAGRPAPVIDGMTGDQRFYLGWAQIWRRKYREANLLQRLLTDPHSPSEQRAAVVRNLDPWYAAFRPRPGDALFLAPASRVRIW
ncbi:MAG TPA: M13-type metalloendopeptidase [Allosphingosinicella sp.]|jgi:putative endopeptidase|nr:M13-type metalloendopeptidase [Allosphingosinicella sp.]